MKKSQAIEVLREARELYANISGTEIIFTNLKGPLKILVPYGLFKYDQSGDKDFRGIRHYAFDLYHAIRMAEKESGGYFPGFHATAMDYVKTNWPDATLLQQFHILIRICICILHGDGYSSWPKP